MPASTITSKGQITIPKEVRDALALGVGDRVSFRVLPGGRVEMVPETVDLLSLCGVLRPAEGGVSVEAMGEAIRSQGGRS
ncbi:MAG: AbrB/MazE/SpoVT family DNA-binding domain-containing protein [Thermoanaerobaculaceae bacterium]